MLLKNTVLQMIRWVNLSELCQEKRKDVKWAAESLLSTAVVLKQNAAMTRSTYS